MARYWDKPEEQAVIDWQQAPPEQRNAIFERRLAKPLTRLSQGVVSKFRAWDHVDIGECLGVLWEVLPRIRQDWGNPGTNAAYGYLSKCLHNHIFSKIDWKKRRVLDKLSSSECELFNDDGKPMFDEVVHASRHLQEGSDRTFLLERAQEALRSWKITRDDVRRGIGIRSFSGNTKDWVKLMGLVRDVEVMMMDDPERFVNTASSCSGEQDWIFVKSLRGCLSKMGMTEKDIIKARRAIARIAPFPDAEE